MAIDSTNLVVALKAFSRSNPLPLDSSEIHDSLAAAQTYADSAKAYAGQTIKALVDGKYKTYVLDTKAEGTGFELTEVGGNGEIDPSQVKTYVQVVTELPTENQEQGVIYINTTNNKGYIYNGTDFQVVFEQVDNLAQTVTDINTKLDTIQGTGEGSITKALEDAKAYTDTTKTALQQEIAEAVANADHLKREIVNVLPEVATADANTIYMVAKTGGTGEQQYDEYLLINGTFEKIGDSAVDLSGYVTKDELTSQISTVKTEAAEDATTKADAAQAAAIAAAATDATTKADAALESAKQDATTKANQALTDAKAYTDTKATETLDAAKAYTDTQLEPVINNLNTKVDQAAVDAAISTKVGDIAEGTTVKQYIDTAVGSGGTASAEAIAQAKQEAIQAAQEYTDSQALVITEF